MMYAVLLPVMLGAASLGVETLRVMRAKMQLQNALDAAALAAGHARFQGASDQGVQAVVDRFMNANLLGTGIAPSVRVNTGVNTSDAARRVTLDAIATLPGVGMGLSVIRFRIGAHAAAETGLRQIDIALALDSFSRLSSFGPYSSGAAVRNFVNRLTSELARQGQNVLKIVVPPSAADAFVRNEFRHVEWIAEGLSQEDSAREADNSEFDAQSSIANILTTASQSLDQRSSFGTGASKKIIILVASDRSSMTNGNASYPNGEAGDESIIGVCNIIKARDIVIYTIDVAPPTNGFSENLRRCASSQENYFRSPSASSLDRTLASITADSSLLRLAE